MPPSAVSLAHFGRVAHDLAADGVERVLVARREDHQRLLRAVGKAALGDEAKGDLIAFIGAAALDEAVQEGSLSDHFRDRHQDAVKQRGLVIRMGGVFLIEIRHQLGHVELVLQANFTVGAVRHEIAHDALQPGHFPDPASVASVAPSSLRLFHISALHFLKNIKNL